MAEGDSPKRAIKDMFDKASGNKDELGDVCDRLEAHKNQQKSQNHTIVDKKQLSTDPSQDASQSQVLYSDVCETQHPELLCHYCKVDNYPGPCVDCMTLKHVASKLANMQKDSERSHATRGELETTRGLSKGHNIHRTASHRECINAKSDDDTSDAEVDGYTLLDPRRVVVTDGNNNTVKVIDMMDNIISFSYCTSSAPCGITKVDAHTVAVTFPEEGKIELLNVTSNGIKHLNKIRTSTFGCYRIAYQDGTFDINYHGIVEITDIRGKVLHTTVLHVKDTVILSDHGTNKVIVVTFESIVLQTFTHDRLTSPTGIALAADCVLMVCSQADRCLQAVSPDFKSSKIIIGDDEHVLQPGHMAYCDVKQRLYLSNDLPDEEVLLNSMQVYDVNTC